MSPPGPDRRTDLLAHVFVVAAAGLAVLLLVGGLSGLAGFGVGAGGDAAVDEPLAGGNGDSGAGGSTGGVGAERTPETGVTERAPTERPDASAGGASTPTTAPDPHASTEAATETAGPLVELGTEADGTATVSPTTTPGTTSEPETAAGTPGGTPTPTPVAATATATEAPPGDEDDSDDDGGDGDDGSDDEDDGPSDSAGTATPTATVTPTPTPTPTAGAGDVFSFTDSGPVDPEVYPTETFRIGYEVTNTGAVTSTQTVEVRVDFDGDGSFEAGELVDSREVTLDSGAGGGSGVDVTVPESLEPGRYEWQARTGTEREENSFTVLETPTDTFFFTGTGPIERNVSAGDTYRYGYDVANGVDAPIETTQVVETRLDVDRDGEFEPSERWPAGTPSSSTNPNQPTCSGSPTPAPSTRGSTPVRRSASATR